MTEEEFTLKQELLLVELPDQFRNFVVQKAWQDGHSCGYDEVLSIVQNLVAGLVPAVETYREFVETYSMCQDCQV